MQHRVDFYLLPNIQSRLPALVRLCHKIYQQQQQAWIVTRNQVESKELDDYLWTYHDTSFLPHQLYETIGKQKPIHLPTFIITDNAQNLTQLPFTIVINLTNTYLTFVAPSITRILELVLPDELHKINARKKYQYYQALGCDVYTHTL